MAENPFSTKFWIPGVIPFLFPERDESIDTLLGKMYRHPICQIVGPHGSGKSTLLLALLKQHKKNGDHQDKDNVRYLIFNDQHRRFPRSTAFLGNPFLFVDGFEQLPFRDRLRLLSRSKRLVFTTHHPVWFVPILFRTKPQLSVFVQIVQQMLSDPPEESVLHAVYVRSRGNFRNAFFELYDRWEHSQ